MSPPEHDQPRTTGSHPPPPPRHTLREAAPSLFCMVVLALSVGVFLLEELAGLLTTTQLPDGERVPLSPLALYGPLVRYGEVWRVLGNVIVHGNLLHLALNMSVVWSMGTDLERHIGTARMAQLSLATALGATALALLFNFDAVTVGASGMILGWAGAMLPISTREGRRSLTSWLFMIGLLSVLPLVSEDLPAISWAGHLGGFLAGLPAGLALRQGPRTFRWAAPLLILATALAVAAVTLLGGLS